MSYAIEISGLTKEFLPLKNIYSLILRPLKKEKPFLAINDVNLRIKQDEIFCLMGPNGAGKTTLIKILSCLLLPTKGRAEVMGHDVLKDEAKVKSSIGLIGGDERNFYWRLTLRQNLYFFAKLYDLSNFQIKRKIEELSHLLEINGYLDKRFQECSSGIKQRLTIARGLLNDAKVLFMDEPMKSLDLPSARNLKNFIKKKLVEEQGKIIFFISHNLNEVENFADQIAIMHKSEIRISGTLSYLRNNVNSSSSSLEEIYTNIIKDS